MKKDKFPNRFVANVPIMEKRGCLFALEKCVKNTP